MLPIRDYKTLEKSCEAAIVSHLLEKSGVVNHAAALPDRTRPTEGAER